MSELLTQAENQGHSGLSTQLWSGMVCGEQWLLELASSDTEEVLEKTLWRWFPASTALLLQGCGCSVDLTPSHPRQQKGQLAVWPMDLLPLVPPGLCLRVCGLW